MEVSEESIRQNNPLPPLPKFDLKQQTTTSRTSLENTNNVNDQTKLTQEMNNYTNKLMPSTNNFNSSISNNNVNNNDIYSINESDKEKYSALFNKNKDNQSTISTMKVFEMFRAGNVPIEAAKKITGIVTLKNNEHMDINEFSVVFHLIYKYYNTNEIPDVLPQNLQNILLGTNQDSQSRNSLNSFTSINDSTSKSTKDNNTLNISTQNPLLNSVTNSNTEFNNNTSTLVAGISNNNYYYFKNRFTKQQ